MDNFNPDYYIMYSRVILCPLKAAEDKFNFKWYVTTLGFNDSYNPLALALCALPFQLHMLSLLLTPHLLFF